MIRKLQGVTLMMATVAAIGRRMQDGEGGAPPSDDPPAVDVPFVETGAFIAIVVCAGVLVLCIGCCITCTVSNSNWVARKRAQLEATMEIAKTPKGDIEYKKVGNAPYMLFMPGTPGFGHATVGFEKFGFGLICVSRPGYGRTPLTEELKKSTAQADLIVALMDHLGIEKFPILAASGAGVIGLRIAIQYPDKVQCLNMCCATTGKLDHWMYKMIQDEEGMAMMNSPLVGRMGHYMMPKMSENIAYEDIMTANKQKENCVSEAQAKKQAAERMKDPYLDGLKAELDTFAALGCCYPDGWHTMLVDLDYYKDDIPYDQVKVPVHMIHGECDNDIYYSQAVQAHKGIEGSILITAPLGTHSLQFHSEWNKYIDQQMAFAKKHCGMEHDAAILEEKFGKPFEG